ncbi:MAG: sulfite exporter TauE/SafE family protein [Oscillospiraceae bacterium]|nr:sulfite exporter TauE/SafE family protein [Oscillospiraceae bacterium]
MPEIIKTLLIVCPLVFLAGFVDSVAGGGGLISLPAYLFCGIPAHMASGTNKVVNSIGTSVAAGKYIKSGKINLRYAIIAAVFALLGSAIGTEIATLLSDRVFKIIILCALPTAAIILTIKKDFGKDGSIPSRSYTKRTEYILCAIIGLFIGCYDGMVGPGTGTFMIMAFTAVMGMDLLTSSGCAKVGNLASNIASAIVWIINGHVYWALVIPAAACNVLGNYLGARYAIKGGSKRIRSMIFVVLALLFVKILFEII